jgi:hypothetical protein
MMGLSGRSILVVSLIILFVVSLGGRGLSDTVALGTLSKIYVPVEFTHDKHMVIESNCSTCHHYTKEGDTPPCAGCHGTAAQGPKKKIALGLKDAYHGLCTGCHKKISGPVECAGCHIKKKKDFDTIYLKALSNIYQPVRFSHGYHIGLAKDCPSCHHFSEPNKTPACTACHESISIYKYKGLERKTGLGLKAAYHGLCVGCHEKGSGPAACNACHSRKADKR